MWIPSESSNSSQQNSRDLPEICCSGKKKTVPHISYGGMDDHLTVATLPDEIKPQRAGKSFRDYLQSQRDCHDVLIQEMIGKQKEINLEIEGKVETVAEILRSHVLVNQNDIDCVVKNCKDLEPITVTSKEIAVKEVKQLAKEREDDIHWLKREGMQLERERADKLRLLLREYYNRLVTLGRDQPHEILLDFDDRIYEINQQLVSNIRAYIELEAELKLQVKEEVIKAKSTINSMATTSSATSRGRSAISKSSDKATSKRRSNSWSSIDRGTVNDTTDKGVLKQGEFDECVTKLVDIYKTAVLQVFSGFQVKLEDLLKDLNEKQNVMFSDDRKACDLDELQQMMDRVVKRLSSIVSHKLATETSSAASMEQTRTDAAAMQTSLHNLGEKLRNTYMILHDAGHLWDAHMMRLSLAQKLTLLAVEDLITSNDTIEITREISTNVAMASLRAAPTDQAAKAAYEEVVGMLDDTAKMHTMHSQAEFARLEEFMQLLPVMASTLMAEFEEFLVKHPLWHGLAAESTTHQLLAQTPRNSYQDQAYLPLPRAILQTELQSLSLQNWRDGFLESLKSSAAEIPEMLTEQAQQWLDERAGAVHTRYALKMISHSVRPERMKALLNLRLAELQSHADRLKSHTDAVKELTKSLHEIVNSLDFQCPRIKPLVEKATEYQGKVNRLVLDRDIKPERRRIELLSYLPRLETLRRSFNDSVMHAFDEITMEIEDLVQAGRISNVRFLSNVNLFHEGGWYNAVEAMGTANALSGASDAIESTTENVLRVLQQKREEVEKVAESMISDLKNSIKNCTNIGERRRSSQKKPKK